ncbi:dystroglycan-related [Anaeramoeba flamelloides]|uniref:Dystroglycan-related n=1 Tax=Anaeramoeba flamelloides TaxID=1746091 RepID=A0AAV7Y8J4_9EUKA|nr:dystroglycan-related [Anaeramoeba flamelloides]
MKNSIFLITFFILTFFLINTTCLECSISKQKSFLCNSYTDEDQINPTVQALSNSRYAIAVWSSYKQNGTGWGIFGQLLYINTDDEVTLYAEEFQIKNSTQDTPFETSVSVISSEEFVVVWSGKEEENGNMSIYGQTFTIYQNSNLNNENDPKQEREQNKVQREGEMKNDGEVNIVQASTPKRLGAEFQVNTYNLNHQTKPSTISLSLQRFVVIWSSSDQDGSGWGIFGKVLQFEVIEEEGSDPVYNVIQVSDEFQVNDFNSSDQRNASVCGSNSGFVVSWTSETQDNDGYGIYGQAFLHLQNQLYKRQDVQKIGAEFQISSISKGDQMGVSLSCSSKMMYAVWQSHHPETFYYGIYGQMYNIENLILAENDTGNQDLNIQAVGEQFEVDTQNEYDKSSPNVVSFLDNHFMVSYLQEVSIVESVIENLGFIDTVPEGWQSSDGNDNEQPYQTGDYFPVNHPQSATKQGNPIMTPVSDRHFMIAYSSKETNWDIYVEVFKWVEEPYQLDILSPKLICSECWLEHKIEKSNFVDQNGLELSFKAMQKNGEPLPDWLNFDEKTLTFSGNAPKVSEIENFHIFLSANNECTNPLQTSFIIQIIDHPKTFIFSASNTINSIPFFFFMCLFLFFVW